jgi:class 3 adenylate cyclase/predicted ATPase
MDISEWLRKLGLEQYATAFRQNDISPDLLPTLSDEDLKELGVASLGHRRRLLQAVAALRPAVLTAASEPSEPSIEPEAERRQVTVMFYDLVGSTVLSTRLDPEDLQEVIGGFQRRAAETISRFEGFVARYMGDGALAYFGYPHAHEDDAEQAVRAGLALIDAVGELQAPNRLQVRVGIATGVVVVGDLIGTGSAQEQTILGETPNLAARLQALAEPNTVAIAEGTRRQIGTRFEVCGLGPQSLKGFADPQRVWRVMAENRTLGRFEALRSGTTPLIGRGEEMELLIRRWARAKDGRGRVVLISGEPGVGKSRLAEALAERIASEPHVRLRYFCSPHHQNSALYPVIAQMERAAGFAHKDSPGEKLAKLQAVLAAAAPPIEDVALIAELHSLPAADLAPPLDVTPQRKKEKAFEALLRQVESVSRRQPLLMVFEDIHWIDPSSRTLLEHAIERIAKWPVLLVATFRPEFQAPWVGQPHIAMLTLSRLDRRDTAAMVANIVGNATLPDDIVQEIAERTDGVPLFVEELTNAVLESETQATLSSVPHPALAVPATLHASLMARLDRLGPAAKGVAQTGAAIGREFAYELLASVATYPEPQLRKALDQLATSGLLIVRGTPPHSGYLFKHALVQDAAYSTLLRGRRRHLHGRIAAALEDRFPEIVLAQPALLAHHCAEGGLAEKAILYWLKAGRQAIARSAMTEAVAQLHKGLDVLPALPDCLERRQLELDLRVALRPALAATKGFAAAEVGETLARARALAEQIDRPQYLLPLSVGQWGVHSLRSEHKLALSVAEQIEKFGEARNDLTAQLLGRRARGVTCSYRGEFLNAHALLERCRGLSDPSHRVGDTGMSYDPYAAMLAQLGVTLAYLGHVDRARSRLNEALSEARRLRHAHTLAFVLSHVNWIDSITCSPDLQRHAEQLLALSTEHGFSWWLGLAAAQGGRSMVACRQAEAGLARLTEGLAAVRATGSVLYTPLLLTWLAEAEGLLERYVKGLHCLAEAAHIIEITEERFAEAELHRLRGNLLKATGDRSGAERSYHQALAVAQGQSAKLFELRAATSLARLWLEQCKIPDARALLAHVYKWFTEGFDAPDLLEAKALLDHLEGA